MTRPSGRFRKLDSRGVAAVEYALVLPVFLAMVFGIIEIGRLMWYQVSLQRATAVATRCGAVTASDCTTAALIAAKAAVSAPGITLPASAFTVSTTATCGVQVSASLQFKFLSGYLGLPARTLTATDCHPKTQ